MMMKNMLLCSIAGLFSITMACGGGPTAPTATTSSTVATAGAPPAPTPTPPEPTPTPVPAPAPDPAPVPTPPSPAAGIHYAAHVDTVHWYGDPLFGGDFELMRYSDHVTFAAVTLPIVQQDDRGFLAKNKEMTFAVIDSKWTFNGIAGTAQGMLSK